MKTFLLIFALSCFSSFCEVVQGPMGRSLLGEQFVDFGFPNLEGEILESDKLREGKYLLLKIGRLDCPLCVQQMEILGRVDQEYQKKGVVFLDVSTDTDIEELKSHSKKYDTDFETLIDEDYLLVNYYQIEGIPVVLIVDQTAEAKILFHRVGVVPEDELRSLLDKLVAKEK